MVGTGFVVQGAVAAQNDRVAETRALADAANIDVQQLDAHGGILEARAVKQAEDTLAVAGDTIAAAQGKADATALAASVAALDDYKLLAPERVFALVDSTEVHAAERARRRRRGGPRRRRAGRRCCRCREGRRGCRSRSRGRSRGVVLVLVELAPRCTGEPVRCAGHRPRHAPGPRLGRRPVRLPRRALEPRVGVERLRVQPSSGAYGIPQALPGSKMATAGADWQTNPATQISWGLGYITGRYGTPCGAWDTFNSQGWY